MHRLNDIGHILQLLYPGETERAPERFARLQRWHRDLFGFPPSGFVSAPGRTELGGNHTDHNRGCVLAAAVSMDAVAGMRPVAGDHVRLHSEGFPEPVELDLRDLAQRAEERHTSRALVRGVAARLKSRGFHVGGFDAVVTTDVGVGSGLSSSAAFEVLVGGIFSALYNEWSIPVAALALAGQEAENEYFGKPCGLMDQLCSATGGTLMIDFKVPAAPVVAPVRFEPEAHGYALLVVDTGGNHADLAADYASIPLEMRSVARALGQETCRDVDRRELMENMTRVREACGDRALLRCLHFLDENERVGQMAAALLEENFPAFLALVRASGLSSIALLQNAHSPADPGRQGVALALAMTERFLKGASAGACRLHGGGFAGTIQAYVPAPEVEAYRTYMSRWFGPAAVTRLRVRAQGVQTIPPMLD
jgi:galactokinase